MQYICYESKNIENFEASWTQKDKTNAGPPECVEKVINAYDQARRYSEPDRCHSDTLEDAQRRCITNPKCKYVTKDNGGYETRGDMTGPHETSTSWMKVDTPVAASAAASAAAAPVAAVTAVTAAPITAAITAAAVAAAQSASVLAGVAAAPVDPVPEASSEIISGISNMTLYITAGVAVVILLVFLMK